MDYDDSFAGAPGALGVWLESLANRTFDVEHMSARKEIPTLPGTYPQAFKVCTPISLTWLHVDVAWRILLVVTSMLVVLK